jgi:hypothetical protein
MSSLQRLDFGKILVPARSLNDGEHYGGTEEQEFGLEDRMVELQHFIMNTHHKYLIYTR